MDGSDSRRAFILENTRIQPPPHTPELNLHLADEVTPIWRLTEEALAEIGLPPPFWAFAWAGGQALARYVLDHPDEVAGKRVVDFASGSGIVGIAAMRAGAGHVLATDIDPFCGAALAVNGELNGGLQIVVPRGWTVRWTWFNADSSAHHSLVVMTEREKLPTEGGSAAFTNAMTRSLKGGLVPGGKDVTSFVAALVQAEQLGVSIVKILRIQSDQMRVKRRQRAQEKAQQAPVKMIIPMVLLIFPSIWIVLLGPSVIILIESGVLGGI